MKYLRRCIRIKATDSPNVQFGLWEIEQGRTPTGKTIVPGMIGWHEYQNRKMTYPQQLVVESLEADWYEGAEERLVPDEWMDFAARFAGERPRASGRRWMGVDSGEGGDDSSWVVIDDHGVLDIASVKTPDTNAVYGRTCFMVRQWGIRWEDVIFDYGGGGKEHVDRFRAGNFPVRGVRFGAIKRPLKRGMTFFTEKEEVEAETAGYVNRRSEMAYEVRLLLERPAVFDDPVIIEAATKLAGAATVKQIQDKPGFAMPMPMCEELRRQLACIPLDWDDLGRFKLIPKKAPANRPNDTNNFFARIGRSPDQFDGFCLAVWGRNHEAKPNEVGVS